MLGRRAARKLNAATPLTWELVGAPPEGSAMELRLATADDGPSLLAWRNDPATRAGSIAQGEVAPQEHAAWLTAALASSTRRLFVGLHAGEAIGQVRLDHQAGTTWEISITVAPSARGRGHSKSMLVAAEQHARELGAKRLVATIRPSNDASIRAFKAAGYYGFAERTREGQTLLRCERRIVTYVR